MRSSAVTTCVGALLLIAASCTDTTVPDAPRVGTSSPTEQPSPAAEEDAAAIASLPPGCSGTDTLRRRDGITFIKNGRLFATDHSGSSTTCVARQAHIAVAWGPVGDRFFVDGRRGRRIMFSGARRKGQTIPGDVHSVTWSHPTGKSLIYISHDWKQLLKVPATGGEVQDISFLDSHIAVAYHPAGTHIAVAGERDGEHGIYLATNTGNDPQLLAQGEGAWQIDRIAFDGTGEWLYFTASHKKPRERHIHALHLIPNGADESSVVREGRLRTIHRGKSAGDVAVSAFSRGLIAFEIDCARPSTYVFNGRRTLVANDLRDRITRPIGWLPKGRLVLLAFDERCDESRGDLYVWRDGVSKLLVENVEAAAVRAAFPPAPDPPGAPQEVVA